jgi:uncharacterized protein (TIGR00255 family)
MLLSMTGFARAQEQTEFGLMACELRSLNHRYLEIGLKLPEGCKEWESDCRDKIQKKLSRGKVDCLFQFIPNSQYSPTLTVNQGLIHQLIQATGQISNMPNIGDHPTGLSMMDLLNWPGVVNQEQMPTQQLQEPILSVLALALDKLVAVRKNEGQKLSSFLAEKLQICMEKLAKITLFLPDVLALKKQKLTDKLAGLKQEVDGHRLEQELIYFAQRLDVIEEIERFDTHLQEVNHILTEPKPICEGRRLDFLMQEMQREINTLNNKSLNSEIARLAVDLKVIIEQMREQIQNIE